MTDSLVLQQRQDGVATLTLNRPERRNALSPGLLDALIAGLEEVKADPEVKVVVITGAGDKAFCAGGDLGGQQMKGGFIGLHEGRARFVDLFHTLFELGKPTIARVNGTCLGGGIGLMLGCDLVVASEDATFGTPEIKVGLFPMMIMALIFRNVGRKRAMEMILTGERMDAQEAHRIGLINRLAPASELDEAVAKLAGRVGSFSPAVLKLGR
ncbi:MAG: enoyl-CoA hydratase-related protein, partial [Myxococcota bacterium]|nr:enoyl-CoA hydratase-related protein [Myxococcota bacterium]